MDDGERQERRVGGKDVNRSKAVERCYVAKFEDGERTHKPKDDGHPLEGKRKQGGGNGPFPTCILA